MRELHSKVLRTADIYWKDLKFIQHDDFKQWVDNGDQKLRESLLRYQFIDPFKVWEQDGTLYCLDGRHRFDDLCVLQQNISVPDLLPATFIDCADVKEAAELVLVYSSHYAKITQDGLNEYVNKYGIDVKEVKSVISIPDFSFDRFEQKFDLFGIQDTAADEDPEFGLADIEIVVKPGDVFDLGNHRIICGSFSDLEVQNTLMQGELSRIIFTDPPYNIPMDMFTNRGKVQFEDFAMGVGEMTDQAFVNFLEEVMHASVAHSVPGAIHYICMDHRHVWHMGEAARKPYGSPIPKQMITWVKDHMANGSFYRSQQELVFVLSTEQAKALWHNDLIDEGGFYKDENDLIFVFKNGDGAKHLSHLELQNRIRTNVWRYPSANSTANPDRSELKNHPTPKPVAMIADAILDTTNPGDLVTDWFLGSGSTLIACEKTGRGCRGSDLEPKYIQHIICRYHRYCQKTGRHFSYEHVNGQLTIEEILQTETV